MQQNQHCNIRYIFNFILEAYFIAGQSRNNFFQFPSVLSLPSKELSEDRGKGGRGGERKEQTFNQSAVARKAKKMIRAYAAAVHVRECVGGVCEEKRRRRLVKSAGQVAKTEAGQGQNAVELGWIIFSASYYCAKCASLSSV